MYPTYAYLHWFWQHKNLVITLSIFETHHLSTLLVETKSKKRQNREIIWASDLIVANSENRNYKNNQTANLIFFQLR